VRIAGTWNIDDWGNAGYWVWLWVQMALLALAIVVVAVLAIRTVGGFAMVSMTSLAATTRASATVYKG
jgi:hypothetical protein